MRLSIIVVLATISSGACIAAYAGHASAATIYQAHCYSGVTGSELGFVYGRSDAELLAKCAARATDPHVGPKTEVSCDPTAGGCSSGSVIQRGDKLYASGVIGHNNTADRPWPPCGGNHYANCLKLCITIPKGFRATSSAAYIGDWAAMHGLCSRFPGDLSFPEAYSKCNHGEDQNCRLDAGTEGMQESPKIVCDTFKNWSGHNNYCARLEVTIAATP